MDIFLDKIFLRTDVCDDHSSNDKSPGGTSTRASSQNSRMDSEIKRTMKSAQTGVVRQLKQETRATQLLFVSDLTPSVLKLCIFKNRIFDYQKKESEREGRSGLDPQKTSK